MNPADSGSPLVSIGMPVYNGERFLREALDSLSRQNHPNLELIVSDNGSTDGTREICLEYAARDPRIRALRRETTVEATRNFDYVLGQAKGGLFMWAACDDLWEPSFVSTLAGLLTRNPDAVLAFCAFDNIGEHGEFLKAYPRLADLPAAGECRRLWNFMLQKEGYGKANLIYGLMRTAAIRQADGCRPWGDGPWGVDMLTVFRLLAEGGLVLSRELLFHKRAVSGPTALSAPKATSIRAKMMSDARAKIRARIGYLKGYARVLDSLDNLAGREKILLRLGLFRKMAYIYWRETMQTLVSLTIKRR